VTWSGEVPGVKPFEGWALPLVENGPRQRLMQPNPNAPRVDAATRGLGNAVVFLRGVEPRSARPWDHPPVRVEQRAYGLHVCQGEADSPFGFVRLGDPVEMVSRDRWFHSLHADGAVFFTLAFPDPDQPLTRHLNEPGVVELTSAAGYYWMRAYLLVGKDPYFARTDSQGRFVLDRVPPGRYEVVGWLPSWREARHERDPETGLIVRMTFRPPVEVRRPADLAVGETRELELAFSAQDFER
jgi:hypothetical protein